MYEFDPTTDPNALKFDVSYKHPDLRDLPMRGGADVAVMAILDKKKSLEERLATKQKFADMLFSVVPPAPEGFFDNVDREEIIAPGLEGEPDVRMIVVKPKGLTKKKVACYLYFFAGGFTFGTPELMYQQVIPVVEQLGVVCVLPEYRLLPEHIYPSATNDAEAAFNYIYSHAEELGIDRKRIVANGGSAGATLSACLAVRLKMRGGPQLGGMLLESPALDDTLSYPSSAIYLEGAGWNPDGDQLMFETLMGPNYNRAVTPADCAPGRLKDFSGMPPTIIHTGALDYEHDACIAFAQGLMNAGVYCSLHIFGGCFHGYRQYALGTKLGNRTTQLVMDDLEELFSGEL